MLLAHHAAVFAHLHVQDPVYAVLNLPVPAHGRREARGLGGQTAELVAPLGRRAPVRLPHRFHHSDAAQGFPLSFVRQPTDLLGVPVAAGLNKLMCRTRKATGLGIVEKLLDLGVLPKGPAHGKRPAVLLHCPAAQSSATLTAQNVHV
jgi:hypothetical protein